MSLSVEERYQSFISGIVKLYSRLQVVSEPLHEDGEEAAEAGVDVHRDAAPGGDGGDPLDRVHRAVRVGRRRAKNLFSGKEGKSGHQSL